MFFMMLLHCVQFVGDSIRGSAGQPVRSAPAWLEDRFGWNRYPRDPYRLQATAAARSHPSRPGTRRAVCGPQRCVAGRGFGGRWFAVGDFALVQQLPKGMSHRAGVEASGF